MTAVRMDKWSEIAALHDDLLFLCAFPASAAVRLRWSIGCGSGTIDPEGKPATIVRPAPGPRSVCEKVAELPRADAPAHASRLPGAPA